MRRMQIAYERRHLTVKYLIAGFCLTVIYLAIFLPLLSTSFFPNSDDVWYVLDNPQLKDFDFINVFTLSYQGQYSPLNTLFLYLIKQAIGLNVFYYHLYSLILHTANAIILYLILVKLIKQKQGKNFVPFLSAFLFLFHPLQIEAVAWVSASKWLLVTFFMLLSILFYLKYRICSFSFYAIYSFTFFVLAMLSKEIGVILPLLLSIIEVFFLRTKYTSLKKLLPFFLLSFLFGIFTLYIPVFQPGLQQIRINVRFTPWDDTFLSIRCVGDYIFYLLIPVYRQWSLGFITGHENILPAVASVFVVVLSVWLYFFTNQKLLMGCFLLFTVSIFFSLPIIPASRAALIADRYVYIAGIGIWGSLVYMITKQKPWIKIFFSAYLSYIIIVALVESLKWYKAL